MGQDDTVNENLLTTSFVDPLYASSGLSRLASQDRSLQRKRIEDFLAAQEIREAEAEEDRQRDYGLALIQASAPLIAGQTSLLEGLGSAASTFAGDAGKIKKEERAAKRAAERLPLEMGALMTELSGQQLAEDLKVAEATADIRYKTAKALAETGLDAAEANALEKFANNSLGGELKLMDKETRDVYLNAVRSAVDVTRNRGLEAGYKEIERIIGNFRNVATPALGTNRDPADNSAAATLKQRCKSVIKFIKHI
jgi:hypothetical protein